MVIKILKNRLGEYAIWWGIEKANKLAYRRFFKKHKTAEQWASIFKEKLLKRNKIFNGEQIEIIK